MSNINLFSKTISQIILLPLHSKQKRINKTMDQTQNRFLSVSYQLYTIDTDGKQHLEEETQQGRPFQFISGFGFSLDAFEQQLVGLSQGERFDFTLTPGEAFGDYDEEGVHKMQREVFMINDKFDDANIFPGAIITLMDAEEKRFMARVTKVESDGVTVDTNHPLAGKTLQFKGLILENREPSTEELQQMLNHMSHECGGCDCGDCGDGGCGGHGCGHCH